MSPEATIRFPDGMRRDQIQRLAENHGGAVIYFRGDKHLKPQELEGKPLIKLAHTINDMFGANLSDDLDLDDLHFKKGRQGSTHIIEFTQGDIRESIALGTLSLSSPERVILSRVLNTLRRGKGQYPVYINTIGDLRRLTSSELEDHMYDLGNIGAHFLKIAFATKQEEA